jgi:hypothetical protein
MPRPQRGSRNGLMSGVNSTDCAMAPWLKSARASVPMARPTARQRLRLKVAPSARPVGKEVGQPELVNPVAGSVCGAPQPESTPCNASPKRNGGMPSRGTPLLETESSAAASTGCSRGTRSATRSAADRAASQKGRPASGGSAHEAVVTASRQRLASPAQTKCAEAPSSAHRASATPEQGTCTTDVPAGSGWPDEALAVPAHSPFVSDFSSPRAASKVHCWPQGVPGAYVHTFSVPPVEFE